MRYGISAAALIVHEQQILLVNHRVAGQYDFWLPPGGRLEGEEMKIFWWRLASSRSAI
jgi:8-oxo-dGTP diphosphatase